MIIYGLILYSIYRTAQASNLFLSISVQYSIVRNILHLVYSAFEEILGFYFGSVVNKALNIFVQVFLEYVP